MIGIALFLQTVASSVVEAAWSANGAAIAAVLQDGTVKVWDAASGQLMESMKPTPSGTAIAISRDGRTVVAGENDSTVYWWQWAGSAFEPPQSHRTTGTIEAVAISPNGRQIATGSHASGHIFLIRTEDGKLENAFQEIGNGIASLSYSGDGALLASAGQTWRVWDPARRIAERNRCGTPMESRGMDGERGVLAG